MSEGKIRWLPLESNPDVMNKYIHNLGIKEPAHFTDVFGFEDELLAMVPQPVLAVLLLFPLTQNVEQNPIGQVEETEKLYFSKQTIGNACGTMGIIHSIANNVDQLSIDDSKHFITLYEKTKDLKPLEKAKWMETDTALSAAHEATAQEGQTEAPSSDESQRHHFVAFVHRDAGLYELDGRRDGPVRHGDTSPDGLLKDAVTVIQKFIKRDSEETGFSVIALCKNND